MSRWCAVNALGRLDIVVNNAACQQHQEREARRDMPMKRPAQPEEITPAFVCFARSSGPYASGTGGLKTGGAGATGAGAAGAGGTRGARSCVSIRLYFFSLLYSVGRYTPRMLAALRLLPRVRSSVCRIASSGPLAAAA